MLVEYMLDGIHIVAETEEDVQYLDMIFGQGEGEGKFKEAGNETLIVRDHKEVTGNYALIKARRG